MPVGALPASRKDRQLIAPPSMIGIGVIIFIMTRKMIRRIASARLARLRLLPRASALTTRRTTTISASPRDRRGSPTSTCREVLSFRKRIQGAAVSAERTASA